MRQDISEADIAAFLARYNGVEAPDWKTPADLTRMGMESMARHQASNATRRPVSDEQAPGRTGTHPGRSGANEGDE